MEENTTTTTTTTSNGTSAGGNRPPGNVRLSTHLERLDRPKQAAERPKSTSIKAVLLGDYGVGKTTLFRRIKEGSAFEPFDVGSSSWESQSTDTCCKHITTSDNRDVQLALWDTAGAERYRTLTLDFFRKALIVYLVYRTDKPQSLSNLRGWMEDANPYLPPGALFVLIGNVFADSTLMISAETGEDFAKSLNISINVQIPLKNAEESTLIGILTRSIEEVLRVKGSAYTRELAIPCETEHNIRLYREEPESNESRWKCPC